MRADFLASVMVLASLACTAAPALPVKERVDAPAADSTAAAAVDTARAMTQRVLASLGRGDTLAVKAMFPPKVPGDTSAFDNSYESRAPNFLPAFRPGVIDLRELTATPVDSTMASAHAAFWLLERDLSGGHTASKGNLHLMVQRGPSGWRIISINASRH